MRGTHWRAARMFTSAFVSFAFFLLIALVAWQSLVPLCALVGAGRPGPLPLEITSRRIGAASFLHPRATSLPRSHPACMLGCFNSGETSLMTSSAGFDGAYSDGSDIGVLDATDLAEMTAGAEEGDAEAQYFLGLAFRDGNAIEANPQWAAHWLSKAADQNDARAQLEVGKLFLNGVGVGKDPETAAAWVSAAANQGLPAAQYQMGMLLLGGVGVEMNGEWASYWFEKVAEQDVQQAADARYRLGLMYRSGNGVPEDRGKALFWFERAAELGHKDANIAGGAIRRQGRGPAAPGNTPGLPAKIRRELWGGSGF